MATSSSIEWTDATWNPTRGCIWASEGGRNRYQNAWRAVSAGAGQAYEGLSIMTSAGPRWANRVQLVPEAVEQPLHWKKPRLFLLTP